MSRLDESRPGWPLCLIVLMVGAPAGAQTIADYSRAQRAWIEAGMEQAAARAAALAAPAAASAPLPTALPAPIAARRAPDAASTEPPLHVSGVFTSASSTVAEVVVNGNAYMLASGQAVPGTPWRVDAISSDRVVFGRSSTRRQDGVEHGDLRKIVLLPSPAPRVAGRY